MKMARALAVAVLAIVVLSGCATQREHHQQQAGVVPAVYNGNAVVQAQHASPPQPVPQMVQVAAPPTPVKKYLNIGAHPVDPKRPLRPGESLFSLGEDTYAVTKDRAGKASEGWLKAGEQVFAVPASDPRYWEAVAIKRCGNPILNREQGVAPIWIYDPTVQVPAAQSVPTQQAIIAAHVPAPMSAQQPIPECRERKSGWGSVIGGGIGFIVGLLTHKPAIAAATSAGGSLIGGYMDGKCIDPQDAVVAVGWGVAGYGLTKPKHQSVVSGGGSVSGPAPLPSNGGGGPGGIPVN